MTMLTPQKGHCQDKWIEGRNNNVIEQTLPISNMPAIVSTKKHKNLLDNSSPLWPALALQARASSQRAKQATLSKICLNLKSKQMCRQSPSTPPALLLPLLTLYIQQQQNSAPFLQKLTTSKVPAVNFHQLCMQVFLLVLSCVFRPEEK